MFLVIFVIIANFLLKLICKLFTSHNKSRHGLKDDNQDQIRTRILTT